METTPYPAPTAAKLASRSTRLKAAFIDGLLLIVLWVPFLFRSGYFEKALAGSVSGGDLLLSFVGGFALFAVLQGWPLATSAQTWGKKVYSIRIEHLDGSQPTLAALLLKRYLPVQFVGSMPVIGPLSSVVDALFIFRDDRRCLHDLIAGTQVVEE